MKITPMKSPFLGKEVDRTLGLSGEDDSNLNTTPPHTHEINTPERMKFSLREKILVFALGAAALGTAGYFINKNLDHDPSVTYPDNTTRTEAIKTIKSNELQNDIYANGPANTTIRVKSDK